MRSAFLCLLAACGGGGDSCPDFVTITGGTFVRSGPQLTWTLSVEAISSLTFNKAPENVLEYRWGVELDGNRDGNTELRVAATHFATNEPEVTTTDIIGQTQVNVWTVSMGSALLVGSATATLANNTFTFTTTDSEDPGLAAITALDQSTFVTGFFQGADASCSDSFKP